MSVIVSAKMIIVKGKSCARWYITYDATEEDFNAYVTDMQQAIALGFYHQASPKSLRELLLNADELGLKMFACGYLKNNLNKFDISTVQDIIDTADKAILL